MKYDLAGTYEAIVQERKKFMTWGTQDEGSFTKGKKKQVLVGLKSG